VIVKMSKIEVIGPRDLLVQVLGTIQRSETLQIDADIRERMGKGAESRLKPLALDGKALGERLFYEDLALRIERLLALLPVVPSRPTRLDPSRAVNSIASLIGRRTAVCEEKARRRESLQSELNQLNRYLVFLTTVESLAPKGAEAAGLDVIAVEARDRAALERLTRVAGRLLLGTEVRTARGEDGSYIGLLTTEKQLSDQLRASLRDDQIPEVSLPPYLEGLPLADKIKAVRTRYDSLAREAAAVDRELQRFASRWRGLYQKVHDWLEGQLSLLKTSALAYGTDNCFVLFGWVPAGALGGLKEALATQYGETVIVQEKEILEQDLETVPVALKNPLYFQPFELLVSLLPLPRYTSVDPTPFIGVFFPLFFGMILGDVGYGLLLLLTAIGLIVFAARTPLLQQAGRILGVCAVYSILFGVLYGECFGQVGAEAIGLTPGWIDRRTSFMPMLYFAVAMGGVHVLLGLALGVLSAMKGRRTKEAAFRLFSALAVVCIAGILASYFAPVAALIRRPLLVAILVIAPLLLLTGGLLAPFELLRYLGNIVSYVRIMAVGLASVLLAYVANSLAGAAGSIWVGIGVAVLLHSFNLVLGVFAPTIHALRLHYVEFFSKFLEPGGKHYQPLKEAK
jgi:V/A-type H+-transporting ATPase subunit I